MRTKVFIHEYLTPQSYSDTNSHTGRLFEIVKFRCNRQQYLNIIIFVNRISIGKVRSASCKLAVVTGKWNTFPQKTELIVSLR